MSRVLGLGGTLAVSDLYLPVTDSEAERLSRLAERASPRPAGDLAPGDVLVRVREREFLDACLDLVPRLLAERRTSDLEIVRSLLDRAGTAPWESARSKPPVYGYIGFSVDFCFDAEGRLVGVGVWE